MQNVPKIVRERLKAATPAAQHPDANALAAFAERLLPERERALVFDHLARCGDCRDIVAWALPATEPIEVAAKSPARGWLTWPVLRWGLVAAGVMAIASLGIVQYQRGAQSRDMASKTPAQVEVAAKEVKNEPLAQPASSADEKRDQAQAPPTSAFRTTVDNTTATGGANNVMAHQEMTRPEPALALPLPLQANRGAVAGIHGSPAVGGALPHGPRLADQWQQQNVANKQVPAAPPSPSDKQQAAGDLSADMRVPAVSESVAVEAQSAHLEAKTQNLDGGRLQDQAAAQPSGEDYAVAKVGKAKPAANTPAGATPVSTMTTNSSQMLVGPVSASSAPAPRWTITSTGGLRRSLDQGVTWKAIDVMANPESSTNAASRQISANNSRAKRKDAQALKRDAPFPSFRAVAANGAEVWAGGSGGVLYHSQDAGDHWTRIVPAAAGSALTGDILSLEFPDPQHGKVSTSAAEIWITADDGQTWQKQ
jgi:hypothetical protein